MADDKDKNQNKKDHADFQDQYRRSSNFAGINEDETEDLKIKGEGEVGLKQDGTDTESDKEKIKDAMDQINLEEE